MFELSVRWGYRPNNPARGIAKLHEEKRNRRLSDEELERLLKALDEHPNQVAANAIRLQLLTGARIGEVLSAKWKHLDLDSDAGLTFAEFAKRNLGSRFGFCNGTHLANFKLAYLQFHTIFVS